MDRSDEARRREHEDDEKRPGETLGLGGAAAPKSPQDPVTEYDEESVAKRRKRMSGESDDTAGTREDPDRQRSGATGIDMGGGGEGTHIRGR